MVSSLGICERQCARCPTVIDLLVDKHYTAEMTEVKPGNPRQRCVFLYYYCDDCGKSLQLA